MISLQYLIIILMLIFIIIAILILHKISIFKNINSSPDKAKLNEAKHRKEIYQQLEKGIRDELAKEKNEVTAIFLSYQEELRLQFFTQYFFNENEAYVTWQGRILINRIIEASRQLMNNQLNVDIECHTNSNPAFSSIYPGNWELSASRASNILCYFTERGYDPLKMKASG